MCIVTVYIFEIIINRVIIVKKNKLILDFISEKIYNVNVFIKISFNNQIFDIE